MALVDGGGFMILALICIICVIIIIIIINDLDQVGMASKPLHVRRLQKALQEWVQNPGELLFIKDKIISFPISCVVIVFGSKSQ